MFDPDARDEISIAAVLHNSDNRDPRVVIVKKKFRGMSNTSTEGPWRLFSETKKYTESNYETLERGLMEELNISEIKSMSKMMPNSRHPDEDYTFRYHLSGSGDVKNLVRVYIVGTTDAAIKGIRPNLKELDGHMYTKPQQAFSALSWQDEKMCVARFCKSKNLYMSDGMRKSLQPRKTNYKNVRT